MRWTVGTLAGGALGIAALAFAAGRLTASRAAPPPAAPPSACPELSSLDPSLAALDLPALERRYREGYALPPSTFARQLDGVRAAADVYVPARRACMLEVALIHAIVGQEQAIRSTPALFGLAHPSEELRRLYLTLPLAQPYTDDERLDVIAQLEENILASVAARSSAEDAEHWRRRYYGLLLVCSVTDGALAHLDAARPGDCLHLAPRAPKHDPSPAPRGKP